MAEQLQAFRERFGPRLIARARALHETPYQLLTVASMVEREALIPGDRAKIAAVIYNRLRLGMPLGIDATIYYAVEQQLRIPTYTGELTEAQLHIDSPYNTRTHTGLPPTPISNPGMASIEAAAHPAHVPYLYYVAGADGCGEQVFSNTAARIRSERRGLPGGGAAGRRAAPDVQEAPRMTRLGVLGWPVAHSRSPAMHNAALRELGLAQWQLPAAAGAAGALRGDRARARRRRLRGGERDDPAQAGGARARRQRRARPRGRSGRRTRSPSTPPGGSPRRTPTPRG